MMANTPMRIKFTPRLETIIEGEVLSVDETDMGNRVPYEDCDSSEPENVASFALIHLKGTAGDPRAQFELGTRYAMGLRGVTSDSVKAQYWYEKSASAGHPNAQYSLGFFHQNGHQGLIEPDLAAALKWYKRAADQGVMDAYFSLGVMHYKRQVPEDPVKEGSGEKERVGEGVDTMTLDSMSYFRQAAEKGHLYSMNNLGVIFCSDLKRFDEGLPWLERAALMGDIMSMINLAVVYHHGIGVPKCDQERSQKLVQMALRNGGGVIDPATAMLCLENASLLMALPN